VEFSKGHGREVVLLDDPAATFACENALRSADGAVLGTQVSRVTFSVLPAGFLLVWEAVFKSDYVNLTFGERENSSPGGNKTNMLGVQARSKTVPSPQGRGLG